MVSPKRVIGLSVLAIGVGVGVAMYALMEATTPEAALPATPTASYDPAALRAAATAVGRQVQATAAAQRVDLATRVAAVATQTPGVPRPPAPLHTGDDPAYCQSFGCARAKPSAVPAQGMGNADCWMA